MRNNKKLWIIVMVLLVVGMFSFNVESYAGVDDLIVMGVGCVAGGLWDPLSGGQCGIWGPDTNEGDCGKCNRNPLQECSKYQCRAIGENCVYDAGQCVDFDDGDLSSPQIIGCDKVSRYDEYKAGQRKAEHQGDRCDFGEIVKGRGVVAHLRTDEIAKCKYDVDLGKDYQNMLASFEIFDEFSTNHYLPINPGEGVAEDVIKECENEGCRMFVKCMDVVGNVMPLDYAFIFELEGAGTDLTPPRIEIESVDSGFTMKHGDHILDFGLLVSDDNGVEGCKYSKDVDLEYDLMTDTMSCVNEFATICGTTLENIDDEIVNEFYFRCKDKVDNTNGIGHRFLVIGGKALEVDALDFNGGVFRSSVLVANTLEGSGDGLAECSYSWKGVFPGAVYNEERIFDETYDVNHKQSLNFLDVPKERNSIEFDVRVRCRDDSGNIGEDVVRVNLKSEDLVVNLGNVVVNGQDVVVSVNTEGGYSNDGKSRCELYQDDGEHTFTGNGISLGSVDRLNHGAEVKKLLNGEYSWTAVCEDLSGRSLGSTNVNFDINTPELRMEIDPKSGNLLNVDVEVKTFEGVDDGKAKCKYVPIGDGFDEGKPYSQYAGLSEDSDFIDTRIFELPKEGIFGSGLNEYFVICIDEAGKTVFDKLSYNINYDDFGLNIESIGNEFNVLNPVVEVVTKGGFLDGDASCRIVDCEDLSLGKVTVSNSVSFEDGYKRGVVFRDLKNGGYSCNMICSDVERDFGHSFGFSVDTPELGVNVVWPRDGENVKLENLDLIVETFNGNNNGNADCYWTDQEPIVFEDGGIVDITKREDISYLKWSEIIGTKVNLGGGGYRHTKGLKASFGKGVGEIYVQCKDNAGKLGPEMGPLKVEFEVT